jgi:hypothetical protein
VLLTPTFVGLWLAGAAFWTLSWAATYKREPQRNATGQ